MRHSRGQIKPREKTFLTLKTLRFLKVTFKSAPIRILSFIFTFIPAILTEFLKKSDFIHKILRKKRKKCIRYF